MANPISQVRSSSIPVPVDFTDDEDLDKLTHQYDALSIEIETAPAASFAEDFRKELEDRFDRLCGDATQEEDYFDE